MQNDMRNDMATVQPGWRVIAADGEDLGELESVETQGVTVRKGWLFPTERYVPASAIASIGPAAEEVVYLAVTKEQLEDDAYDRSDGLTEAPDKAGVTTVTASASSTAGLADRDTPPSRDASAVQDGPLPATESTRVRTHEEELEGRAVPRQTGEVVVTKDVVEETRTIEVPVRREEVHVERQAVSDATANPTAFQAASEAVRVPVMEEQVEVRKVVRPVEDVVISKEVVDDTQAVSGTVRREEVHVTDDGAGLLPEQQH